MNWSLTYLLDVSQWHFPAIKLWVNVKVKLNSMKHKDLQNDSQGLGLTSWRSLSAAGVMKGLDQDSVFGPHNSRYLDNTHTFKGCAAPPPGSIDQVCCVWMRCRRCCSSSSWSNSEAHSNINLIIQQQQQSNEPDQMTYWCCHAQTIMTHITVTVCVCVCVTL